MSEILDRIDETLTFYSAGLGEDITVSVEPRLERLEEEFIRAMQAAAQAEREALAEAAERRKREFVRLNDTKLVHYLNLAAEEREALRQWIVDHNLEPRMVPVYADWGYDAATNEYRIPVHRLRDGRPYVTAGEVARAVVRRLAKRPLPWREFVDGP